MEHSEWTVVTRKKGKSASKHEGLRHNKYSNTQAESTSFKRKGNLNLEDNADEIKELEKKLRSAVETLQTSGFYQSFSTQLDALKIRQKLKLQQVSHNENQMDGDSDSGKGPQIVAYGIGSISDSQTSRLQICLAILISRELQGENGKVQVFDPVLTDLELEAMKGFNCEEIMTNEEGKRTVFEPTLFFMPHCEAFLYDNLLSANIPPIGDLRNLVILGNSFNSYKERWETNPKPASQKPETLLRIQPMVEEFQVEDKGFHLGTVFNDMSWHFFSTCGNE